MSVRQLELEVLRYDPEQVDLPPRSIDTPQTRLNRAQYLEDVSRMDAMARRIHELVGWHIELYADARELDPLLPTLIALPAVAIDHLGLSKAGFPTLLELAEHGVLHAVGLDAQEQVDALELPSGSLPSLSMAKKCTGPHTNS